jgi:hypothetical protein
MQKHSARRTTVAPGIYRENGSYVAGFTHPISRNWTTRALPGVGTITAAKKARAKLIADLEAGRIAPPTTITVAVFAAEWLAGRDGRVRPRTFEADGRNVRIISRQLGAVRLQDLDGRKLEQFLQQLRSGKATGNRLAEANRAPVLHNAAATARSCSDRRPDRDQPVREGRKAPAAEGGQHAQAESAHSRGGRAADRRGLARLRADHRHCGLHRSARPRTARRALGATWTARRNCSGSASRST